jgi:hypothetical protein
VESGGSIVTIGSSTSIAEVFGIGKNHLVEKGPTGRIAHCLGEIYIPGSLPKLTWITPTRWPTV